MKDPLDMLGLPSDADDDAIRVRYLTLVKEFPPERNPEKFAEIRKAYEATKNLEDRLRRRLFEPNERDNIPALIDEMGGKMRPRISLSRLLELTIRT